MTARQEAYDLNGILPDDSVKLLVELLKRILPASSPASEGSAGSSVRFGLGKGILTDPTDFDRWDAS